MTRAPLAPDARPSPDTDAASARGASPASHWRRRKSNATPIPRDQAARQGAITQLAFLLLGREWAIEFLNTDHAALGGRPLALATESAAGQALVEAEIGRLVYREPAAG